MDEIKISLTVLVPGAKLLSEQECSKYSTKPIIVKKGRYKGKQARDKDGKFLYRTEIVPDPEKCDKHVLRFDDGNITFYTRKQESIRRVINMYEEAYDYFISNEMPPGYHAPKGFKPKGGGGPINAQAWKKLSIEERLNWHLNAIAISMGGTLADYKIFDD
jgi:hypothetical protein